MKILSLSLFRSPLSKQTLVMKIPFRIKQRASESEWVKKQRFRLFFVCRQFWCLLWIIENQWRHFNAIIPSAAATTMFGWLSTFYYYDVLRCSKERKNTIFFHSCGVNFILVCCCACKFSYNINFIMVKW